MLNVPATLRAANQSLSKPKAPRDYSNPKWKVEIVHAPDMRPIDEKARAVQLDKQDHERLADKHVYSLEFEDGISHLSESSSIDSRLTAEAYITAGYIFLNFEKSDNEARRLPFDYKLPVVQLSRDAHIKGHMDFYLIAPDQYKSEHGGPLPTHHGTKLDWVMRSTTAAPGRHLNVVEKFEDGFLQNIAPTNSPYHEAVEEWIRLHAHEHGATHVLRKHDDTVHAAKHMAW